jgi:hypothetical protein
MRLTLQLRYTWRRHRVDVAEYIVLYPLDTSNHFIPSELILCQQMCWPKSEERTSSWVVYLCTL